MDADKHGLINHYEALVHEYRQDLERNVQLARNASGDPYGMLDRINEVLVAEIARLKVSWPSFPWTSICRRTPKDGCFRDAETRDARAG